MITPHYKDYQIRGASIRIDDAYESNMGIYGDHFWNEISNGIYEVVTFDFLEGLQGSGYNYFIDIGAATGCMSLYAASTGLRVISIEPQELVYSALLRNVELNPSIAAQISLVYALVSKSNDKRWITDSFTPGAGGPIASGALTSNLITIEDLLKMTEDDAKVAIKIDIEGAEFPLLTDESTLNILKERKPTIYLALHPGFKKPLKVNANVIQKFSWRILAVKDVINLYSSVSPAARIYVASDKKNVRLLGLLKALMRDEKDFLLVF
jgi:FkbM family methyltransferase